MQVYVDGRLVDERQAHVSVFDRGFLFGDGIFESMRAVSGIIFRLERHLERLRGSASLIDLVLPGAGGAIAAAALQVIRVNGLRDARLRVTVTRGPGRPGDYLESTGPPTVVIAAQAFTGLAANLYEAGVPVTLSPRQVPAEVLDPAIKSTSRLASILARREARARGGFEAILTDGRGMLSEGTVSNVFLVSDGVLKTPSTPAGCLPGVTRQAVIDLARGIGMSVAEERVSSEALATATEVFLTNSSWEVLPVAKVDAQIVGSGRPGPVSRRLLALYRTLLRSECCRV